MTVPSTTSRDSQTGNGVTVAFTVPFRILDQTHIQVLLTVAGVTTVQVLTTNYSVSGVGGASTTVTFVVAPPAASTITFLRNVPATQETDYVPNDPFPAESHERALDKLTMLVQQLDEVNDRSLTLPAQVTGVSTELPVPVASNIIGWNSLATALRNYTLAELATIIAYADKRFQVETGDGVAVNFALDADPGSLGNLEVSIDGVMQVPGIDFTYLLTTLTFTVAPANGAVILIRYDEALPTGVTNATAVNYLPNGTGAVQSTVAQELGYVVRPEHYGAVGDGVADDLAALNAACTRAAAAGAGVVLLRDEASYGISGRFVVPDGVSVIGQGAGQFPAAGFATSANFKATPKTRIVALTGFPAATPMVDVAVTRGVQYAFQGVRLEGFLIDCDQKADIGLRWKGVKNSSIRDVAVYRPTTGSSAIGILFDTAQGAATGQTAAAGGASTITFQAGLAVPRDGWFIGATITTTGGTGSGQTKTVTAYNGTTKVATVDSAWGVVPDGTTVFSITGECLEGNGATQYNVYDSVFVWLGNTGTACGIEWNGDGLHDCNQNSYRNFRVIAADGPAIRMYNGDTDWFDGISTFNFGIGNGLECYGSETTSYEGFCRQQFFKNVLFGGANAGGNSGTATAGGASTITLAVGASATNDFYKNKFITTTGGTGANQRKRILSYDGATRVATVSAWAVAPDATTTYTIPNGGGVAMFSGAYRTSRWHEFSGYETQGNGAGLIYFEDGGAYTQLTERDMEMVDVDGFEISLGSGNAYTAGTRSRINFKERVRGLLKALASIRFLVSGAEGSENGSILFFTTKAGAAAETETFRISDGIQLNSGALIKRILTATATVDFGSVAANSQLAAPSTITVTGALVNDVVTVSSPSGGGSSGIIVRGWVSATDTVTLAAMNVTTGAIDPASASYRVYVMGP